MRVGHTPLSTALAGISRRFKILPKSGISNHSPSHPRLLFAFLRPFDRENIFPRPAVENYRRHN